MAASIINDALDIVLERFKIEKLKTEQRDILNCLIDGKDAIAVLPTGYGKSLPFQLYIPVKRLLNPDEPCGSVIVCTPLISLMQDQVEKISRIPGVTAAYKGSSAESDKDIKAGKVDIIYASPETLVGDPEWRTALQQLIVSVIVVDEFHTIATWGLDSDGSEKKAFRKWFSHIGELRSLFPNATFLAMSATCTLKIRKRVVKVLTLKPNTVEITISPNKPNIKFVTSQIPNSIEMSMCWLVDGLSAKGKHFPRTMIYCRTIKDTASLYEYIIKELPECAQYTDMYHSLTPPTKKDAILEGLKDAKHSLRVIIATSALGMGIDVVEVYGVIVFGAPDTLVELLQQVGRIGRDGKPSVALLLYNSFHLRNAEKDVKEVFNGSECRRLTVLKSFLNSDALLEVKKETGIHTCCDICSEHCPCGQCTSQELEKFFHAVELAADYGDSDVVSTDSENTIDYEFSGSDNEGVSLG